MGHSIPKIIHYCWFGGREKPDIVKKCIDSWEINLPGYEIKEWNESNFNINDHLFTKEAYEMKNYAFVSDYVRVYVLYLYGGIYLDTDTEIVKNLDRFLIHDSFWGFEEKNYIGTSLIGAKRGNQLIKQFLDFYESTSLINDDGTINSFTNVSVVSQMVTELGINLNGKYQEVKSIAVIYPQDYFSPYDYINCYMKQTTNTCAIHHFHKSWLPLNVRIKGNVKKVLAKMVGGHRVSQLRQFITKNN